MAKRKKRVNTGLVGFVTMMAILIAVTLVAVFTISKTDRDPEAYAGLAEQYEKAGDRELAMQQYVRAYGVNQESKYAIEATRLMLDMGNWREAMGTLIRAHQAEPSDTTLLSNLLVRYWELAEYGVPPWQALREYSAKVLGIWNREIEDVNYDQAKQKLDQTDLPGIDEELRGLAVISLATALAKLPATDDRQQELADRALEIARRDSPHDPRVVRALVEKAYDYANFPEDKRDRYEHLQRAQSEALELINAARQAAPDPELDNLAVSVLSEEPIYGLDNGAYQDLRRTDEAMALLREALKQYPDNSKLKTTFAQAVYRHVQADENGDQAISTEQRSGLINEARGLIRGALEADPGFYQGVNLLANLAMVDINPDLDPAEDELRRTRNAVEIYDTHRETGVTASTLRAAFGTVARMQMLFNAFQRSLNLTQQLASRDGDQSEGIAALQRFDDALQSSYPEMLEAQWVSGRMALINEDENEAIRKFTEITQASSGLTALRQQLILDANQQLTRLFYNRNQLGESERYADAAIQKAAELQLAPPTEILALKLSIMVQTDRAQQALDQIEALLRNDPDNQVLNRVRAQALVALDRTEEARETLEQTGEDFAGLAGVRLSLVEGDLDGAIQQLDDYLESNPEDRQGIDLLVQTMSAAKRTDELIEKLDLLASKTQDESGKRWIEARKVFATITDPDERLEKLLTLIDAQDDPVTRAIDRFNAFQNAGKTDEALQALNEIEKLEPDNVSVLEQQFVLALRDNNLTRAEEYVRKLGALDADSVGGALYRGELALAQDKPDIALSELIVAESKLPPDANLKAQLARAYLMSTPRRITEATAALEAALELNPRHASSLRLLFLLRADQGLTIEDPEFADLLRRAWRANLNDPALRPFVEQLAERDDPVKAIANRERIREESPDDAENLLRLALLYQRPEVGNDEKAGELFMAAERIFAETDLSDSQQRRMTWQYYRSVADFFGIRNISGPPEELLRRFIDRVPAEQRPDAELLLARYYFQRGDREKTMAAYDAALVAADQIPDPQTRSEQRMGIETSLVQYHLNADEVDEAIARSESALKLLGESESQIALAQTIRLGIIEKLISIRPDDARRRLDQYRVEFPNDIRGLSLHASLLLRQQQLDEALDALTLILRDAPTNAWALDQRGGIKMLYRKYDEARRDLLAAKRENPWGLNLRPRYRLARLYELTDQPQLAEREYLEILDEQPENLVAARQLLRFYRRTQQFDAATNMLSRFAAKRPDEPFWSYELGMLLALRGNAAGAMRPLEQASELTGWRSHNIVTDWARIAIQAGRARDVLITLEAKRDQINPTTYSAVNAAASLALGDTTSCVQEVEAAIRSQLDQPAASIGAMTQRMEPMVRQSNIRKALESILADESISDDERLRLQLVLTGSTLALGDLETTESLLADARKKVEPQSPNYRVLLVNEAQLLEAKPDTTLDQKRAIYEELLEIEPSNIPALNNLAFALAQAGAGAEAQQYVERLRALEVPNASILDTIGVVFMMNGKLDEAYVQFQQSLREDPEAAETHLHLGKLLVKQDQREDAIEQLNRAIRYAEKRNDEATKKQATELLSELQS
jgi:tetratricopeptide (TPR) repeat protein